MRSAVPHDLEVPITSCPRSISCGTSRVPIAPLAPATNTFIVFFHIRVMSRVNGYDPRRGTGGVVTHACLAPTMIVLLPERSLMV
jgi:hypothetical protein